MSKKKITFRKPNKPKATTSDLGSLKIDLGKLIKGAKSIDYTEFERHPRLARDFSVALWEHLNFNREIKSTSTVMSYIKAIRIFWSYADEVNMISSNPKYSIRDIDSNLINDFYRWILENKDRSITSNIKNYHRIRRLLETLKTIKPDMIHIDFNPINTSPIGYTEEQEQTEPYTDSELERIENACVNDINKLLKRLKHGEELINKGSDPRIKANAPRDPKTGRMIKYQGKWSQPANILWFLVNVADGEYLSVEESARRGFHTLNNVLAGTVPEYKLRRTDAYSYLYPLIKDLLPFIALFSIKTGLNLESIIYLRRDAKKPSTTNKDTCVIYYKKTRGAGRYFQKTFSNKGRFSPGKIFDEILRLTEPLVRFAPEEDKPYLFIGLSINYRCTPVSRLKIEYCLYQFNAEDKKLTGWSAKHDLKDDNGKRLKISFRRTRVSHKTRMYKKTGNLAKVSRDAKHANMSTTATHYINTEATKHIHEETISTTQDELIDLFTGLVVDEQLNSDPISTIQDHCDIPKSTANNVLIGKQDVFISSCKDFYNKPGGTPGKPCDLPWSCFTCKNAVWTSHILPRVIAFLQFIESQRSLLTTSDWLNKFEIPYLIIKKKILPCFSQETIDWAYRNTDTPLFIPNSIRTA